MVRAESVSGRDLSLCLRQWPRRHVAEMEWRDQGQEEIKEVEVT